ncbi:MAG: PQQ-dependent sugar dehydrogenase [Deltaproteobacteria bacterium]|nr:PQQ-dependent sugar dehydrogenase [Deltaproteobacteria bacterium]
MNRGRIRARVASWLYGAAACAGLLVLPITSRAQDFRVDRVATGLARPVFVTAPPGDPSRVFVVEQHTGQIRILRRGSWTLDPTPFLTVPGVSTGSEQGLLGLAFHPEYASNGFFYVHLTNPDSRVLRYSVSANPDLADPGSAVQVLSFAQPQSNHNGGWIGFGIDRYLYVASGDGGGSNDSGTGHTANVGNAQDLTSNRLGKILRVDVDVDGFPDDPDENWAAPPDNPFVGRPEDDEIWVYGLRNPWRASFDRETGDLYIGDVGQGACEEIDVQPAASAGGENYGWRLREGVIATPGVGGPKPPGAIDPVLDYSHGAGGCSNVPASFFGFAVTGGYVYRGPATSLRGRYFFADFATGRLWSAIWDRSAPAEFDGSNYTSLVDHADDPAFRPSAGVIGSVSSFGEDSDGNLYVLDLNDGEVFFLPEPSGELAFVTLLGCAGGLACSGRARPRSPRRPGACVRRARVG